MKRAETKIKKEKLTRERWMARIYNPTGALDLQGGILTRAPEQRIRLNMN